MIVQFIAIQLTVFVHTAILIFLQFSRVKVGGLYILHRNFEGQEFYIKLFKLSPKISEHYSIQLP